MYPDEVKVVRRFHRKTGLVVHLDADTDPVAERTRQLAEALKSAGEERRDAGERICHAIPRRQTETWLCVLTGKDVDEERNCKRERDLADFDAAVPQAALKLYELTRTEAAPPTLPSLVGAIPELRRLEA